MHTSTKRMLAMLCAAVTLTMGIFSFSSAAGDGPKRLTPTTPPWEPGQATMEQLHEFFPHGMFWNHVVGDKDEAYSVTDTACSPYSDEEDLHDKEAGVTCNYFEVAGKVWGGWQCCGYARLLTYAYYGSSFENWETQTTLKDVKEGDVLYLWNYGPHYIWILSLKKNDDGTASITYADCNGTGKRSHCQIQWDALGALDMKNNVMKNPLLGDWELQKLYSAPEKPEPTAPTSTQPSATESATVTVTYALSGGLSGSKQYTVNEKGMLLEYNTGSPKTDVLSVETLSAADFLSAEKAALCKDGCVFAGWSVRKEDVEAAAAQAALYPLPAQDAALWMRKQTTDAAVQDVKKASQNGMQQITLYALWVNVKE